MNENQDLNPKLSFITNGFNIELNTNSNDNNQSLNLNQSNGIKFGLTSKENLKNKKLEIFEDDEVVSSSPIIGIKKKLPNMNEMLKEKIQIMKLKREKKSKIIEVDSTNVIEDNNNNKDLTPKILKRSKKITDSKFQKNQRNLSENEETCKEKSRYTEPKSKEKFRDKISTNNNEKRFSNKRLNYANEKSTFWKNENYSNHRRERHSDPKFVRRLDDYRRKEADDKHKRYSDSFNIKRHKNFISPQNQMETSKHRLNKSPIRAKNLEVRYFKVNNKKWLQNKPKPNTCQNFPNNLIKRTVIEERKNKLFQRKSNILNYKSRKNYGTNKTKESCKKFDKFVVNDSKDSITDNYIPENKQNIEKGEDIHFMETRQCYEVSDINMEDTNFSSIKEHKITRNRKISEEFEKKTEKGEENFESNENISCDMETKDMDVVLDEFSDNSSDKTTSMRYTPMTEELEKNFKNQFGANSLSNSPVSRYVTADSNLHYPLVHEIYSDNDLQDIDVGMLTSIPEGYRRVLKEKFSSIDNKAFLIAFQKLFYDALKQNLPGVSFDKDRLRFNFNMRFLPDCLVLSIQNLLTNHLAQAQIP